MLASARQPQLLGSGSFSVSHYLLVVGLVTFSCCCGFLGCPAVPGLALQLPCHLCNQLLILTSLCLKNGAVFSSLPGPWLSQGLHVLRYWGRSFGFSRDKHSLCHLGPSGMFASRRTVLNSLSPAWRKRSEHSPIIPSASPSCISVHFTNTEQILLSVLEIQTSQRAQVWGGSQIRKETLAEQGLEGKGESKPQEGVEVVCEGFLEEVIQCCLSQ